MLLSILAFHSVPPASAPSFRNTVEMQTISRDDSGGPTAGAVASEAQDLTSVTVTHETARGRVGHLLTSARGRGRGCIDASPLATVHRAASTRIGMYSPHLTDEASTSALAATPTLDPTQSQSETLTIVLGTGLHREDERENELALHEKGVRLEHEPDLVQGL
jgi:hypothetical protein